MSEKRDKPVNIGGLKVMVTPSSEDIERMASIAGELCGHLTAAAKLVEELSGIEVAIEVTPVRP